MPTTQKTCDAEPEKEAGGHFGCQLQEAHDVALQSGQ
jgi:hypothetical protein